MNILTKNQAKFIKSLNQKKNRDLSNLFVAEGEKIVGDLLQHKFMPEYIVALEDWYKKNRFSNALPAYICSLKTMSSMSSLKSAPQVLAVFRKKDQKLETKEFIQNISLVLDEVQDPGNLGTIIRIANWFGINQIVCLENTVDVYNQKVIQATMGAFHKVSCIYMSHSDFIQITQEKDIPVYGTFLEGESVYSSDLKNRGFIVLGNEGQGISRNIEKQIRKKIHIPFFPKDNQHVESLNVAVATGIICSEFRRRN